MTELLFHRESYLKEFEAIVTDVVDGGVILDRTAFYAGGGGQPTDSGVLTSAGENYDVTGIKRVDGQVVHLISGRLPSAGTTVNGLIAVSYTHLTLPTICSV